MHYEVKLLLGLMTKTDNNYYINMIQKLLNKTTSDLAKQELENILKINNNEELYNTKLNLKILITLLLDEHLDKYLTKVEKELEKKQTTVRKQNYETIKEEIIIRQQELIIKEKFEKELKKNDRRRTN